MVNFGADGIFKAGNDLCDEDIETLIEQGKNRASQLQKEAANKLKNKMNMSDFEMNSDRPCADPTWKLSVSNRTLNKLVIFILDMLDH